MASTRNRWSVVFVSEQLTACEARGKRDGLVRRDDLLTLAVSALRTTLGAPHAPSHSSRPSGSDDTDADALRSAPHRPSGRLGHTGPGLVEASPPSSEEERPNCGRRSRARERLQRCRASRHHHASGTLRWTPSRFAAAHRPRFHRPSRIRQSDTHTVGSGQVNRMALT
jgi:hypothetical protein